jgi:hypothetical protein
MRYVVGGGAVDCHAASTSQLAHFETEVLAHQDNLVAFTAMAGQWVDLIRHAQADVYREEGIE